MTFDITIFNAGAEDLGNVQVIDELGTIFGDGTYSNFSVSTTGTLTPNGAYDGSTDTGLLIGTEILQVGVSETITLSFQIDTVSGGRKINTAGKCRNHAPDS